MIVRQFDLLHVVIQLVLLHDSTIGGAFGHLGVWGFKGWQGMLAFGVPEVNIPPQVVFDV